VTGAGAVAATPSLQTGAAALIAAVPDSTPDIVDGVALARLYGEPLFKLPDDLYIPPDALKIFLEAIEPGPIWRTASP